MKEKSFTITIHLGKGVQLTAPFKKNWTIAEWRRMTAYMDSAMGKMAPDIEKFK